ncbi:MAG: hypothetical protein Pg6C_16300 [Treponemataceae bacterium]|nr:MAG: hypothetical protein Pg6C_16300 [Treponemataceae bacterium]
MKRIFAAAFFASCAAILFCQGASGTPSPDDIAAIMSGLMRAVYCGESDDEKAGGNFDSSLLWEKNYVIAEASAERGRLRGKHKSEPWQELESVSYSFNGYSFYLTRGSFDGRHPQKPQVITIDGSLMYIKKNSALTCNLAVRGASSVRTIALNGLQLDGTQGAAQINGSEYDAGTLRELDWTDAEVIDTDMESGIVFFMCFLAMLTTDISEQFEALGGDTQNEVPAGITAVNPENTLKITTQKNQFDMVFNNFALEELYEFSPSPRLNGALTMNIDVGGYDIEAIRYSGKLDVRNMVFVTSMEFDSCIVTGGMQKLSGTITVNGKTRPFSQFAYALKSSEAFF